MVCAGEEGQEGLYRDAPREGAGRWSLRSPRVCTLEMASSHLTGIRACPGLRPSRVSAWLARAHTRVCMQACQQPGGSAALR